MNLSITRPNRGHRHRRDDHGDRFWRDLRGDHGDHYCRDLRVQNRHQIDRSLLPDYLRTLPGMDWKVQELRQRAQ